MPVHPGSLASCFRRCSVCRLAMKSSTTRDLVNSGYYFTCEQIVQMMKTSAFGDEQVKIDRRCIRARSIRRTSCR